MPEAAAARGPIMGRALRRMPQTLLVVLLAACIGRYAVRLSTGVMSTETVLVLLIPVCAAAALSVLLRRGASAVAVYAAAVMSVLGTAVYGGVKDVLVRPLCDGSAQFDSWTGVGVRWMDVVVAVLVFMFVAAVRRPVVASPVRGSRVPSLRWVWPGWASVIVYGSFVYGVWKIASLAVLALVVETPGAWTTCKQATSAGISNVALSTSLAGVSGFQEEIVWTGVGLLLLGAAARWQSVAAIAVTGGVLRALPHMYYTTGAEWYAVFSVVGWATVWSAGTLVSAYWMLRRWRVAGSVAAVALMALGAAVAHSSWNLLNDVDQLSAELAQSNSDGIASVPTILWAVVFVVGFVGGLVIFVRTKTHPDDEGSAGYASKRVDDRSTSRHSHSWWFQRNR